MRPEACADGETAWSDREQAPHPSDRHGRTRGGGALPDARSTTRRITLGGEKNYHTAAFVDALRVRW